MWEASWSPNTAGRRAQASSRAAWRSLASGSTGIMWSPAIPPMFLISWVTKDTARTIISRPHVPWRSWQPPVPEAARWQSACHSSIRNTGGESTQGMPSSRPSRSGIFRWSIRSILPMRQPPQISTMSTWSIPSTWKHMARLPWIITGMWRSSLSLRRCSNRSMGRALTSLPPIWA